MKLPFALRPVHQGLYTLLALAFLASFAYTLWIAFFSPVNGDEIFWKLMIARRSSDAGQLVYLFAQCQEGQWLPAPVTWYPAMALHGFFYEDASRPWLLRVHGWALLIVLLMLWSWLLQRRSGLRWQDAALAICAFFSVGVMPFLMVYSRPEQSLLILLTLALLTTLLVPATAQKPRVVKSVLITLGFMLLAALLAGTHPKGLFLFPIILVLSWRLLHSRVWLLALILVQAWIAYDTQMIWQLRTQCPEFPGLMKVLQNLTLRPGMLLSDPVQFVHAAWANLMAFGAYINSIAFQANYVSLWLPTASDTWQPGNWVLAANALLAVPICLAALVNVLNWLGPRRPQARSDVLLWLTLVLALAAIVCLQTAKNFYEASMIWPLILLTTIFSFGRPLKNPTAGHVRIVIGALMLLGVLSGVLRHERFHEASLDWQTQRAQQIEYNAVLNQSLQQFAYQRCGIDRQAKRLILDKDSYQAFWQHEQPIFLDYAAGWWAAEADIQRTARARATQGLIARCKQVPEVLQPHMQFGQGLLEGFCCIPQQALE